MHTSGGRRQWAASKRQAPLGCQTDGQTAGASGLLETAGATGLPDGDETRAVLRAKGCASRQGLRIAPNRARGCS